LRQPLALAAAGKIPMQAAMMREAVTWRMLIPRDDYNLNTPQPMKIAQATLNSVKSVY